MTDQQVESKPEQKETVAAEPEKPAPEEKKAAEVLGLAPEEPEERKEIKFFKSSAFPMPKEVTTFLKKNTVGIAYNKFCIDCKMNKSTHFIVWTGTFICGACAKVH